ncbi:GreA/GreB family elongation factor [Vibrio sp. SCSIO 43140]|uniref:GreA/GreB family elongation factor n=1 Tax=Vibrio sp. SCSIO 43140 TaxID=2819100 RepID=UPI002076550D|nr:GreA/GreB family elongation factor [Vibrio sp. SCSIO 43140]USD59157.1 GreA/GreB family elongation factor [Vibrio sp. SCSIO 43140]
MDKQVLIDELIEQLEQQITTLNSAMEQTVDAATNEETVPEHKYDTLALEASYLAHGQAMRLEEIRRDITMLKSFTLNDLASDSAISLGALVELEDVNEEHSYYFLLPTAGGAKLANESVVVVTPHSPLGKALKGGVVDDEVSVPIGDQRRVYDIISVC